MMESVKIYKCNQCQLELNKDGTCPRCGGTMVYDHEQKLGLTEGNGHDPDEDEDE